MFIKDLIDFGLSEKEAKVYIALLELEIAPVQEVAKKAGVNRSSTYVVLDALSKKGLISISDDKNIRQYIATSPDILSQIAESKALKHEGIRKKISSIVPELKGLFKGTKKKPLIKVLEGKNGLITGFEDALTSSEKTMRVCSTVENLFGILPQEYFKNWLKRRIEKEIKVKGIHPNSDFGKKIYRISPTKIDDIKLIPKEKFKFPADMAIYDNKIGFMSPNNGGLWILIESKDIADVMKNLFDLAFEEAKKINKL